MIRFLVFATISVSFLSGVYQKAPTFKSSNFDLVRLTDGVFACIHKIGGKAICNIGIIDNGKETIIFDTFLSPETASEIFEVVKLYGLSPIKYVVNSHFHNDHIRGNQLFTNDIQIISTRKTKELIEETEPEQIEFESNYAPERFAYYDSLFKSYRGDSTDIEFAKIQMWKPYYEILSKSIQNVKTTLPNRFVDSLLTIPGPDRNIMLISNGKGHTESDLILFLPDDKILFSGDLVFNECHPYMGNGFPGSWIEYLDFIDNLKPTKIIPGHGNIADQTVIGEMNDYITTIDSITRMMINTEKTQNDISSIIIPEKFKNWMFDRFFEYNLVSSLNEKLKTFEKSK